MKKNVFNLWLLAALLCGMSLGVSSCTDDDKDSLTDEEKEQQALEQQEREMTAFNVLDYLANLSNAPADYLSGTYEPTIGQPDGADATTRIVNTNDMATAALRFADLIDGDINVNTTEYTWQQDSVGTLTYTKGDGTTAWATVDVDIKQIPGLQKIIYRSPEQAGDNTSAVKGTAYYRFGDVVKKKNADGNDEFWICVRPAFYPEGKGDSHWATISALPTKNVWTYTGSNGIDYALPTGLGDSHEHSQNFAEMLFAICFPDEWENNALNTDVSMFHDFDKGKIRYHRRFFWERVQKAWTDPSANTSGNAAGQSPLMTIFGSDGKLEYLQTLLKSDDGLNLLTNGKSWNTSSLGGTNSPTLYRYRFVNNLIVDGEKVETNMHMEPIEGGFFIQYHSVKKEVIKAKISLNCKKDYKPSNPGWSVPAFFDTNNKHYIIRHSTGAKLASDGKENPKQPLTGVTEVYRYNKYYGISDLDMNPEVLDRSSTGEVVNNKSQQKWTHFRGEPHYRFGDIYKDENGHKWMVLLMAGQHFRAETRNYGDSTCFAELISFDGLTPSAKNRKITNLPTRDQAIRAAAILQYYQFNSINEGLKKEERNMNKEQLGRLGTTVLNQVETCNFDIRMLYQIVRAQLREYWDRQPSMLASVAYNDPTDTSGNQRLLRVINNGQNKAKDPLFYLSEHYVTEPDSVSQIYPDTLYDKTQPIYLQDIASLDRVLIDGEDSYVRQPIYYTDAWSGGVTGPDRLPRGRNDVDTKANDVTNYYYDMAKWKTRDFPRDMWNSPVLMFRMTAVYDRGNAEYGTITVDGHTLTPLRVRQWDYIDGNGEDSDGWDEFMTTYNMWSALMCNELNYFWLDGKRIDWPDPFKTWTK